MALYKIKKGEGLKSIPQKDFGADNYEERLEDLLEKTPQIPEGEDVMFIGRQVYTGEHGGEIDLLALNIDGNAIVIELKRGTTPREVIAQALSYTSWINQLGYDELNEIARRYYAEKSRDFTDLISAFREHFGVKGEGEIEESVEPSRFNQKQKIYVIAQDVSEEVARVARFLRKNNIDIACIKFTYHATEGGEEIFETEWVVGEEEIGEVKKEIPKGPGKYDAFFQFFEEKLKGMLPPDLKPSYFSKHLRRNLKQIKYPGFGSHHYELRFVRQKVPQPSLEIALHKENSKYDGSLGRLFKKNKKLLIEKVGENLRVEPWAKNWERLYKLMPLERDTELNEELATKAAGWMKNFIEVIQPLLSKTLNLK